MSTLSADRLPAKPDAPRLYFNDIRYFSLYQETQNGVLMQVIAFGVFAYGLKGQQATVSLGLPDFPAYPPVPTPTPQASFTLTDGLQFKELRVPLYLFPNVLGPPARQFYLALSCAKTSVAFSPKFTFDYATNPCDCGQGLLENDKFSSLRTNQLQPGTTKPQRGPNYGGTERYKLSNYQGWAQLMDPNLPANTRVTPVERQIIEIMATSESDKGSLDTVQSTDNQVLSVGAMQKTIDPKRGVGELNQQLFEFKRDYPQRFKCLIGRCGWDVTDEGNGVYPVVYTDAKGTPYEGLELRNKVREASAGGEKSHNPVIDCFLRLSRDPYFQDKQVYDFVQRLRDKVLAVHPINNAGTPYPYPIGQYLRGLVGRAIALDENVNKQSHTPYYLGAALEKLLADRPNLANHPDPAGWTTDDEHELIRRYAVYRATLNFKKQGPRPTMDAMANANARLGKILAACRRKGVPVDWLPDPTGKKK